MRLEQLKKFLGFKSQMAEILYMENKHIEAFTIIKKSALQLLMPKNENQNQKFVKFTNGHFI